VNSPVVTVPDERWLGLWPAGEEPVPGDRRENPVRAIQREGHVRHGQPGAHQQDVLILGDPRKSPGRPRIAYEPGRLAQLQQTVSDDSRERELERQVALLTQQHEQLMRRDSEAGPYFRAVRFAENGAGVDALIEQTGVTRTEAELIVSLHGKSRAAATVAEDPR